MRQVLEGINAAIEAWLTTDVPEPSLQEPIRYMTIGVGKRVRPQFALAVYGDCGGVKPEILTPALAAIEMLHAASLIHDDLPALDNDDLRRGKPSCHRRFGEGVAILTADVLISGAFTVAGRTDLDADGRVEVTNILARAFTAVNRGQELDLRRVESPVNLRTLYRLKTGALFRAAAELGALASLNLSFSDDLESPLWRELGTFGEETGIVFQLVDDLIDASPEKGRQGTSSDSRAAKGTLSALDDDVAITYVIATTRAVYQCLSSLETQLAPLVNSRLFVSPWIERLTAVCEGLDCTAEASLKSVKK